ncbi:myocardin-related transcription factor A-like isoform X2 [Asterias rubens]|nr:myocardin-related transcription factor A-like isoform X2 [Asterias rubens]
MPPLKASPGFHEQRQRLERAKVGDSLQRKIRLRPEKSHLVNQHILADTHVDPLVNATQQRLKRARLEQDLDSKIKNRPGPLELIEGNILKAETLVEQAVKDGKVKFFKTNSLDSDVPFEFDEDSQEGFSDEALSPSQSEVSQAESQLSTGSLPSTHTITSYGDNSKIAQLHQQQQQLQQHQLQQHQQQQQQQRSSVKSPSQVLSPRAGQTFIAIKQEPGLISPPPITSNTFTPITAVSNIQLSSGKVTPSPRQPRKKQTKRPKPKEIKFHEYKPPNEQSNKITQASTVSNPYNLLLMQQQLYLQLQLLQQQQLILPNTANQNKATTCASSSSTSVTSTHTTSNTTTTTAVAPAPSPVKQQIDIKPNISTTGKPRILSNLEDMKVSELKLELKNRGLHVSGTKPQLVERLKPYAELNPISTAVTSPTEANIPSVTSSTRVSSSTDLDLAFSESASAGGSLSTPPISPEYRSLLSVTSEPMSPGSAFDPMSPPTFQGVLTTPVCSPDTVGAQSASGREGSPFDQTQLALDSPLSQPSLPVSSSILPMDINNENSNQDMMDVSNDMNSGSQISSDILLQQQLKIQELERMLHLSQMQLQLQMQQQPPSSALTPLSMPQQSPGGKLNESPQQLQQDGKPGFMFHSKDFAHTLNQQPKVFSFATPPPNGQPFLFSKQPTNDGQTIPLPNGIIAPKATSLPNSPTERNALGIGTGMTRSVTQPTFAIPPPNYEEAVRQTKERKSQGNSPCSGSPVGSPPKGSDDKRSTKCQDLDDLLEVLVDHGYQIPITPKFRDVPRTLMNSSAGLTTVTQSIVHGRGGSIDLKLPVPGPSPPPVSHHAYPATDLPMEVDPTDLNISALDLGDTAHLGHESHSRTQSMPFDIPMTTMDNCDADTTMALNSDCLASANTESDLNWLDLVIPGSSTGLPAVNTAPPTFSMDGAFGATLGKDPFPLNLLDLNDISTPTDLHHLEDDVWDNIPVTE